MAVPEDTGYPLKWFIQQKFVRSMFECAVCLEVVKDPVQVRDCGHQFCRYCLDGVFRSQQHSRCPSCQKDISEEMVFTDNGIKRVIDNQEVNCPNTGCEWNGQLSSLLKEHVEICPFLILSCSNNGCDVQVIRKDLEGHLTECEQRTVVCQYCNDEHVFKDKAEHLETCPDLPVECINKCSEKAIPRNKMEEHLEKVCLKTVVQCKYLDFGCQYKCERREMEEHLNQGMKDHLELSTLGISRLKDQNLYEIVKARSLALRFMAANPSCVRAIPYENSGKHGKFICLYVYTEGKEIPNGLIKAAKEMFEDYQIKFDDLQRRPLCKLVTRLPSSEKKREKELSDLAMVIEKNLHIFENRLNVTAVQPSYKVTDFIEQDIACVTVFVLGKGKIPLGESEFLDKEELNGCPFDVIEGYYQPSSSLKSYASPLHSGVGIGVKEQPGAGTLGGFLQDENGKCYLLSCEHVLRPDENVNNVSKEIVQPAKVDFDEEFETVKNSLDEYRSLLERQERKLEVLTEDEKLVYIDCVEETKTKLGKLENRLHNIRSKQPRVVGEYCWGLQENEKVELNGSAPVNIFVDAAIAEMKNIEFLRMRLKKEDETNCCRLYGFNMHEKDVGTVPTAEIVKLEEFDTELQDEKLRFMKFGRSTGLTDGGQLESRRFFKNRDGFQANTCVGKLTHFPFKLYCKNCLPVANENMQVVDISLLNEPSCYKCEAKIASNDKISELWACNCLTIRKPVEPFAKKGDSGSLIFDNKGRTWGIVFGVFVMQDNNICLAAPLYTSFRALEKKSGKKLELW